AKELRLELRDDGDGFKVKDRHDGVGLAGMRERVEQMGGELEITSSRGKGTKITVVLPGNGESTSWHQKRKQRRVRISLRRRQILLRTRHRKPETQKNLVSRCSSLMITALSAKDWFQSSLGKHT